MFVLEAITQIPCRGGTHIGTVRCRISKQCHVTWELARIYKWILNVDRISHISREIQVELSRVVKKHLVERRGGACDGQACIDFVRLDPHARNRVVLHERFDVHIVADVP